MGQYSLSERHACRLMGLGRSTHRYRSRKAQRDEALRARLKELAAQRMRFGYRRFALAAWSEERGVRLEFIQPGKPVQNAYVESFNGRLRDECLNANWFTSLSDARRKIEAWRVDYNQERPHSSLEYMAPAEFARYRAEMRA